MRTHITNTALLVSLFGALACAPDGGVYHDPQPLSIPPPVSIPYQSVQVIRMNDGGPPPGEGHPPAAATHLPDIIAQVPCLDYDGVTDGASSSTDPYVISSKVYSQHLDYLKDNGYTALTMAQLQALVSAPTFPNNGFPARPVLLMSDSTSRWFQDTAAPLLKARGFTATLGVEVDLIGTKSWSMGAGDLRQLQKQGFEIASHTFSHVDLTKVAPAQLAKEVTTSKEVLANMGLKVHNFIYPYGALNKAVIAEVKSAGYRSARGTGAPSLAGGGYAAVDPRRRLNLGCALPTKTTTMRQFSNYVGNAKRLELEDLFVVEADPGKLVTISRSWDFKKVSYGSIYMGDAGDAVSVSFLVTRPGVYDLQLKVKTGIQGDNTYTSAHYAYALNGTALKHSTAGPYEVEGKWVVWGRHQIKGVKLKAGWARLSIKGTKDWAALLDWLEIKRR